MRRSSRRRLRSKVIARRKLGLVFAISEEASTPARRAIETSLSAEQLMRYPNRNPLALEPSRSILLGIRISVTETNTRRDALFRGQAAWGSRAEAKGGRAMSVEPRLRYRRAAAFRARSST